MKRYILNFMVALAGCMSLCACIDDDYTELDKGSDELTLTASAAEITLDEQNYSSDAIELAWSTGNNGGTGQRIYYTLELTSSIGYYCAVDSQTQQYSWSPTVEELNTILLENLGVTAGNSLSVEATVTATVDGLEDQISTVTFNVTSYEPLTTTLYLIGDATPNGWSADNATAMTRSSNGIFTWTGSLTTGNFKFITTLGCFLPSYNKAEDGSLVLRTSDDEADEQFYVEEAGQYKVDVNLFTSTMTISTYGGEVPAYDALYFVGNMTGWGFVEMTPDVLDGFLFRYGAYFDVGGEFKFGTSNGSWENMYKATYENAPYTETSSELVAGYDPDYKWYLQDDELNVAYKICFDIRSGAERMLMSVFEPYEMIWLVGDSTPGGWSLDDATAMTAGDDAYTFTWTGTLNTGELKFTCDRQSDWNGAWFLSAEDGSAPTGEEEQMLFIDKSDSDFAAQYLDISVGDIDRKWKIATAGTYTITLNQLTETVSIVLQ